jgi:hypothetical protein
VSASESNASPARGQRARPDGLRTKPPDPRLGAFADFVAAHDAKDWRAGQLATRRLRALGYSVCLIAPRDDRRGA